MRSETHAQRTYKLIVDFLRKKRVAGMTNPGSTVLPQIGGAKKKQIQKNMIDISLPIKITSFKCRTSTISSAASAISSFQEEHST